MTVLERSELQASTLSDLHAIADQLGLDGFRRLRKEELIDAILGDRSEAAKDDDDRPAADGEGASGDEGQRASRPRRRRLVRSRRSSAKADAESVEAESVEAESVEADSVDADSVDADSADADSADEVPSDVVEEAPRERTSRGRSRSGGGRESNGARSGAGRESKGSAPGGERDSESSRSGAGREAEGVVELLGNGSAFLRVSPPEASDEDVYISAAQVRRCELVSGDRVTGPVRTPRRSERYPSLVRIDTINGAPADAVSGGARYDDLPANFPTERLALGSEDPTLQAIEWLTPLGQGSRVVVAGPARSGKTETLRGLAAALGAREDLQLTVVLTGCRPEEIPDWEQAAVQPAVALSLAASADAQAQALERAIEEAKRQASRGANAVVLIDGLDGVAPHVARKALAAARNLREGGSLTVIAAAARPFGGETTVIALDAALAATGQQPILDLANSGTLKAQLLVGEDGARAIVRAHAAAVGTTA